MVLPAGPIDPITQLPLGPALWRQVSAAETPDACLAGSSLAVVGVDNLRLVNQSHGYQGGDEVLRAVASRIGAAVLPGELVGRLGGARFVVLCPGSSPARPLELAQQIVGAVREQAVIIGQHTVRADVTIGLASTADLPTSGAADPIVDPSASTAEALIALADAALVSARAAGGGQVGFADAHDPPQARHLRQSSIVDRLEHALEHHGFSLWAQRMESLGNRWSGDARPTEVLLRLTDDGDDAKGDGGKGDGDVIGPELFIPIAEQFGLIHHVDLWVVEHLLSAIQASSPLTSSQTDTAQWFINVSPQSCETPGFPAACEDLIRASGIPPETLCFELTETAAIQRLDAVVAFVDRLHRLGCHVALDDFGSGQSSLGHLSRLDINFLKIDGSLVRRVDTDPRSQAVISAIDAMAVAYDIRTIAEHVETEAEASMLSELGIDLGQGWLYERPSVLKLPLVA